jgi:Fe-S-cluster-containing dehydrogenase component
MSKKQKIKIDLTRRDFIKVIGTAAGSVVLSQLLTTGPLSPFASLKQAHLEDEPVEEETGGHGGATGPYHWGMVIDLDTCIGCEYCMRACTATNDVDAEKPWNIVVEEKNSVGNTFYFTRPCLHCQVAPCVEVCPVQATYVRDDGIVVMDYNRCIGCRYCQVACPYDARTFNWEARTDVNPYIPTWGDPEVARRPRGVIEKCTFCIHRIDNGIERDLMPGVDREATPACVNACPVGARVFGNLKDPTSPVSKVLASHPNFQLREELGTKPSVYYIPPKEGL